MENTTIEAPRRGRRTLARLSVVIGTIGGAIAAVAGAASATTSALPNPGSVATTLVNTGGTQLVNTAVSVLPVVIGLLVVFWAINFAMKKIGLNKKAGVK